MFQAYCTTSIAAQPHALLDLREAEVRHADVARLALPHDVVKRAHRLVERRIRIGPVHEIDVDMVGTQPPQALVDRGEDARPAAVAAVRHLLVADAEFGRDDDIVSAAAERSRQRLFGYAHAVGLGRVEAGDAAVDRPRDRSAGTRPRRCGHRCRRSPNTRSRARKLSGRFVRIAGIPRAPPYCAAMAEGRPAKRRSMSRRASTASLSGIATSAQRTISPAAMSRISGT